MASTPILSWFGRLACIVRRPDACDAHPDLHTLGAHPPLLPAFVQASAVACRYLDLLSPLAWVYLSSYTEPAPAVELGAGWAAIAGTGQFLTQMPSIASAADSNCCFTVAS